MESDPLQQLRDVQLPADPSWWPPAPGWWLVALMLMAALAWGARLLWLAWRRRAPLREARRLHASLYARHQSGEVTDLEYLETSNELLKRLLVRGLGRQENAPLSGSAWLEALDALSGTQDFSQGHGRVLGEARFAPDPQPDVPQLHASLSRLLRTVRA